MLVMVASLLVGSGGAAAAQAALCHSAARRAAAETGVPLSVLLAISMTETGRRRGGQTEIWPWTVNMEGAGRWFDDAESALSYAREGLSQGRTSFDVGCFQINYRWHGMHFASVEEMFDPDENALYAARFLHRLHAEGRSWSEAAGAYHSRTPEYAARYRETFDAHYATLQTDAPVLASLQIDEQAAVPALAQPRVNTFPLLQRTGGAARLGSLVPLDPRG